jgi:2-dehydropantoate 2-reductase
MRFAIVGAGAIGAYVGAALARGGHDVTLIARGAHLEAMRSDGVQVLSPRGDFGAKPRATDDFAAAAEADVVFVALKAYSLPELAPRLAGVLKPHASVIWAQNGIPWWYFQSHPGELEGAVLQSVDPGGIIKRSIPPECVVGCVVYCSTEIVRPGVIRHVEGTRFAIGEPDGQLGERCAGIAQAFQAGGLKAPVEARIRDQIWLKLLGNVAFNPITALTGATLGQLGSRPEMVELLRALFAESSAVAEALGVTLPIALERRLQAGIAVGEHKTSMLQDLEAGKRLEVDCLTGAVVEIADRLGLTAPHTRTIHACAKLLDELQPGDRPRADDRGAGAYDSARGTRTAALQRPREPEVA